MEYIDVLDKKGNKTGKSKPYPDIHKDGDWHRAVHIWFINSKGEILLQQRTPTMKIYGNMLCASASGHVSAGESSETSALREIEEEVGIRISKKKLKWIGEVTRNEILNNGTFLDKEYNDVYIVKMDLGIDNLKSNTEVKSFKWVPVNGFLKMVKENNSNLVPHPKGYKLLLSFL